MNLARAVVRHRFWIAAGWAVVLGLLLPQARRISTVLETSARVENSESAEVDRLLAGPLASRYARFALLVVSGVPSPDNPEGRAALERIVAELRTLPQIVGTASFLDGGDSVFIPRRGDGTFIGVGLDPGGGTPEELLTPLRALATRLTNALVPDCPGIALRWTGEAALNADMRRASSASVRDAERSALPLTAALLLLAFGAVTAALIPVISGGLAIALALGAAAVAAGIWPLSILLQSVVSMLGLGLGIDYALLVVSRFREGLASGDSPDVAAEAAARHAGHTILMSAGAILVGFVALLPVPLNEIRAIAAGGILVVTTSTLLSTTLLPGLLASLGRRVDLGRVRPRRGPSSARQWRAVGRLVTSHPWAALLLGTVPLLLLAMQATRLRTGLPRGPWLPPSLESTRGADALAAMGHAGAMQRLRVLLVLPENAPARRSVGWRGLSTLADALGRDPRVERVRSVVDVAREAGLGRTALALLADSLTHGLITDDTRLALIEVVPHDSVSLEGQMALVRELRTDWAPRTGVPGSRIMVGGLPAFNADYQAAAAGWFPKIAALVILGTLVALFAGMRSLLVPVKALALNLLSVGAAFGALTLVFQEGRGASLLGQSEPLGAVFATLPIIVFCVVFGLSMDYELFLVTRVREEKARGRTDADAIVEALVTTGPVITSAALIMLVVFGAFTLGEFLYIKMLGFSLGIAVLLDATIARVVVGPALLQLAGRWNWWPGER